MKINKSNTINIIIIFAFIILSLPLLWYFIREDNQIISTDDSPRYIDQQSPNENITVTKNVFEQDPPKLAQAPINNEPRGLHWDHMPISYSLYMQESEHLVIANYTWKFPETYSSYKFKRIREAFSIIENETKGIISFKELPLNKSVDITIKCFAACADSNRYCKDIDIFTGDYIKLGEAGYETEEEIIKNASINFFTPESMIGSGASAWTYSSCTGYPTTEIHEILHILGIEHIEGGLSIMNPIKNLSEACKIKGIDLEIIKKLDMAYS